MTKFAARLFVAVAVVAGGFLALTGSGTAADSLPPVPPAAINPTVAAAPAPDADDLSTWRETALKTSNVTKKK